MAHTTHTGVRFSELDPYGHVNHSVYIQYFETGRVELLRDAGYTLPQMKSNGLIIVVSEIHTKFLASAEDGDELQIETEVLEFRRVTSQWRQRILRDGELIASQELRAALINLEGRPIRFPEEMISALQPYMVSSS